MSRKILAQANWVLGLAAEVGGSRLAPPEWQVWTADTPVRLQAMLRPTADPDPKAVACDSIWRADTQAV